MEQVEEMLKGKASFELVQEVLDRLNNLES